jgi:PPOX class probable F420-dependent enzyme
MTTLQDAIDTARQDQYLAVVSTLRADQTIQSSVVNAGVLAHPTTGGDVVGFVTYGKTKLANLRSRPQLCITFRAGWEWVAVEGRAELIGPDDALPPFDANAQRLLLRKVFTAAGGNHGDWDEYDRTMVEQRRTAVLVSLSRMYSN